METLKLILQFIGAAVIIMAVGGALLFMTFYKSQVIDYVDQEMENEKPLTIDDLIN